MAELDIQISIEEGEWPSEEALHALAERVLETAAVYLRETEKQPFPKMAPEVSLVFTDDASIQDINAEWRGKDKPTNVLSFPAFPGSARQGAGADAGRHHHRPRDRRARSGRAGKELRRPSDPPNGARLLASLRLRS
jgi:ssRNA-specific RNase YbeY (16S rRNA maturation enzyme)